MRLGFVLLAAVASLLASSNALSISEKSESSTAAKSSPGGIHFVDGTFSSTRSLRGQDPASEDSDDEERGAAELKRVVSSLSRQAQSSVASLNIYDEIKALEEYYKQLQASYMPVFKDLALVKGTPPKEVAKTLGMKERLQTMSMDQLNHDANFHFFKEYKRYWDTFDIREVAKLKRSVSNLS